MLPWLMEVLIFCRSENNTIAESELDSCVKRVDNNGHDDNDYFVGNNGGNMAAAASNTMTFEEFQRLPSEKQSEEIFKLLSMLSPFASEVSSLRSSMENALNRIAELETHSGRGLADSGLRSDGIYRTQELTTAHNTTVNSISASGPAIPGRNTFPGMGIAALGMGLSGLANVPGVDLGLSDGEPDSPHSNTPLLMAMSETHVPGNY